MRAAVTLLLVLSMASVARADHATLLVGGDPARIERVSARLGGTARRCGRALCVVDFGSRAVASRAEHTLAAQPFVRFVERDRAMDPPRAIPDFAAFDVATRALHAPDVDGTRGCEAQWDLVAIGAEDAWQVASGDDAPVIAVADGGFRSSHVDLIGRVAGQHDYGDDDAIAEVEPEVGVPAHGTFITGILAGDPDNDQGRAGLAPGARLYLMKIADSEGRFYLSYAIDALLDLAANHPEVGVLSYSLTAGYSDSMEEAFGEVRDAGIIAVAAAANCVSGPDCAEADNDAMPTYPGGYDGVIEVAGTIDDDSLNAWSHFGRTAVDLAAPGVKLCSLDITGDTATRVESGTSYATPLVAAAIALAIEAHPALEPAEVAVLLRASAYRAPALEGLVASGRLDAHALLTMPLVHVEAPSAIEIDGESIVPIAIENVAGAGLVSIEVDADGVEVDLPSELAIGAHEWIDVPLHVRALTVGEGSLQVRVIARREDDDRFTTAPLEGELAIEAQLVSLPAPAPMMPPPSPVMTPDAGPSPLPPPRTRGSAEGDTEATGCAVGGRAGSLGWLGLLIALIALRNRRARSAV